MKFENSLQEESQAVKIRLKVGNEDFSEVIDKFGDKVDILPIDDYYFIATICEEISPELYIWIRTSLGISTEISSPPNIEEIIQKYFSELPKGYYMPSFSVYYSDMLRNT